MSEGGIQHYLANSRRNVGFPGGLDKYGIPTVPKS